MLNSTPPDANNNNPSSAKDLGNGFLMREGYVIPWVGWGADIAKGNNRLTVQFPIALADDEQPIADLILTEFRDRNFPNGSPPFTVPLTAAPPFHTSPPAS